MGAAGDVSHPPPHPSLPPIQPTNTTSQWGRSACLKAHPNVQQAIEKYCRPRDSFWGFNVPGAAANTPKTVGHAIVYIDGACNPAQWLPWDICFKQFYNMCVDGSSARGENNRAYGRDKCQKWVIVNPA